MFLPNFRNLHLSSRQAAEKLAEATAKTEYINELEQKVNSVLDTIKAERESAAALNLAHDHKLALLEKDYQNNIERQKDKNTYLEKEIAVLNAANTALQTKLDKAYAELRELATKTVESASGVKIVGGEQVK